MPKILVTSALPYANGDIHMGYLVECIQTDIFVRFLRLIGEDVIYMCACDAHGTPIEINASRRGISPRELVEYYHERHREDLARFEISFDEYYTTDSPENRRHCEAIFLAAKDKGHIFTQDIEQYYCENCKRFLPDRYIRGICPKCGAADQYGDVCEKCGATYSPTDVIEPACALCGAAPSLKTSTHYFFKLSDFRDFLVEWTATPRRLQESVLAFVRGWIDQGLQDWDISRDGPYFGFEIPGETDKFFYVWMDAPIGYIAATEHYCRGRHDRTVEEYWCNKDSDALIHHFIGKDIVPFHTLFWPATLKAADYRIPDAVHVHGFLTVDGKKMSKSRGTFITARRFAEFVNPSCLRYYYATKLSDSIDDLDLNIEEFAHRVNSELVNNITNLISRTVGFLNKRLDSRLGKIPEDAAALIPQVEAAIVRARGDYEILRFGRVMKEILQISDLANNFIQQREPWALMKSNPEDSRDVLTFAVNCIKAITILLKPVLPSYCRKVERILNLGDLTWEDLRLDLQNRQIGQFEKLADRLESDTLGKLIAASRDDLAGGIAPVAPEVPEFGAEITMDDLGRVDLRAGKILAAEEVKGSDRLVNLEVDLGRETRTILAGIKQSYAPADLIGRTVVVVANLKPRKMKFGTSAGMILAGVDSSGKIGLCELNPPVPPGTPIH